MTKILLQGVVRARKTVGPRSDAWVLDSHRDSHRHGQRGTLMDAHGFAAPVDAIKLNLSERSYIFVYFADAPLRKPLLYP
jgi:hypothetical protein